MSDEGTKEDGGGKEPPKYTPEGMERYFNDPLYRRLRSRLRGRFSRNALIAAAAVFVLLVASGVYFDYLLSGLPSLARIENPRAELASKVVSSDGEIVGEFFVKNRSHLSLAEVPPTIINALIATEDKDFYGHWGVDLVRFAKAMIKNAFALRLKEGASTITQQLARNLYLGRNDRNVFDTVTRKLREFLTSIELERTFTKDEILEFYLNVVYFGRGSYGIASASQVYFGKAPADLTLGETATLIAMLKGPGYYDPSGKHPERVLLRRNLVIAQMLKYGYITPALAKEGVAEKLQVLPQDEAGVTGIAPHFVEYIRRQMTKKAEKYGLDLYRDGLTVYTTLDSRMQKYANRAVEEHLAAYQKLFDRQWDWSKQHEAAVHVIDQAITSSPRFRMAVTADERDIVRRQLLRSKAFQDSVRRVAASIETGFVALDVKTGGILAMVGGANFRSFRYGLNHVTQIYRQVGSAFKPFVYTVAIDNGYSPVTRIQNQPVTIMMPDGKRWTPSNFDGSFGPDTTIREAIKHSINLVAVRTVERKIAPIDQVIAYAKRMGIFSPLPAVTSLALGVGDISPLEMASAFAVFADRGVHVEPMSILRIEDKDGNIIEENSPERREVFSDATAFIMTSMMEGVVNGGTGSRVRDYFQLPAAGKTGTTTDFADAWFVGYTPQISAAVWVGFDEPSVHFTTWDGQGGRAAAPVWGRFMRYVYDDPSIAMPLEYFERPAGVYADTICTLTEKLATPWCPGRAIEYFTDKTRPGMCDIHTSPDWRREQRGTGKVSY
jgi:penicillin-binding protein 1A